MTTTNTPGIDLDNEYEAPRTCISPLATRPVLYTDTVGGNQTCRDDLWAVTTDELNALTQPRGTEQASEIPAILFDGHAVYAEVMASDPHAPRPTADNIADVLDAVVRLIRRTNTVQQAGIGGIWAEAAADPAFIREIDEDRAAVLARQAAPEAPTSINLSGLTQDRVLEIAKQHFGWVAGLGGFDDAVLKFSTDLVGEAKAASTGAAPEAPASEQQSVKWTADEIADACVKAGLGILECNALIVTLKGTPAATQQAGAADDPMGDRWHSLTCDGTCSPPCEAATTASPEILVANEEGIELPIERRDDGKWQFSVTTCGSQRPRLNPAAATATCGNSHQSPYEDAPVPSAGGIGKSIVDAATTASASGEIEAYMVELDGGEPIALHFQKFRADRKAREWESAKVVPLCRAPAQQTERMQPSREGAPLDIVLHALREAKEGLARAGEDGCCYYPGTHEVDQALAAIAQQAAAHAPSRDADWQSGYKTGYETGLSDGRAEFTNPAATSPAERAAMSAATEAKEQK